MVEIYPDAKVNYDGFGEDSIRITSKGIGKRAGRSVVFLEFLEEDELPCPQRVSWCDPEIDGHLCADCAADRADYAHDFVGER